ncbi:uncharacterized protein A1O9_01034 [Exophiala aquamarina CBS 119918]|uniref:Cytochrome P450 oxidoreductase n=1 Tax=Exophiala aquamarina CBS 119918 TaxID=1182545 RepID=A0A072PUM0_9EURO|nr:uncharacterized protein A1O9_01034 [Exophiala aquamarina CBS 119918]KEF63058.1 hypothetical protein A1O9_01034 [Exophiala aquamarina CBS 119918]
MLAVDAISLISGWTWPILALVLICGWAISVRYQKGFNKYNGPFLASLTNFWRIWQRLRYPHRTYFHDVAKYGRIIRVGPNTLVFNDPEAIKDIYMTHFSKSRFYWVAQGVSQGHVVANIFSTTDRVYHGKLRRTVANSFAMSTLVQYEPYVTDALATFLFQLDQRFAGKYSKEGIFDLADWCRFFALDVISGLTQGRPYGLLEAGCDHIGVVDAQIKFLQYFTVTNNAPWLDCMLKKNPILLWLGRKGLWNSVTATVPVAQQQVAQLSRNLHEKYNSDDETPSRGRVPLVTKFLQAKVTHPDIVDDRAILGLTLSMVNAGSGTVSTTLAATLYFLLKNPTVMKQLLAELDEHFPPAHPPASTPRTQKWLAEDVVIPFAAAQKLPFLDAVIKEVFRLWPALGMQLMERVTPPEGAHILGEYIPGNTIVSCNSWIMHRHKPTFGEDADKFRPSRWLLATPDRLQSMNKAMLMFGAGSHTCIGKNIGMLELYKAVPSLLTSFNVSNLPTMRDFLFRNHAF